MFDISTYIHMHILVLVWILMNTLGFCEAPLSFFLPSRCDGVSLSTWRFPRNRVISLMYVYWDIDPHYIGHGYDPLSHHGSIVYCVVSMIMSIIHGSVVYELEDMLCFHYQEWVCPPWG